MKRIFLETNQVVEHDDDSLHYEFQSGNPVDHGFKWVLIMGRFIGVNPLSISLNPRGGHLTFRWRSFSAFHSIFLTSIGILLLGPQLWSCIHDIGNYPTILDEMLGLQGPTVQLSVVSVSIYLIRSAPRLIRLLQKLSATISKLSLTTKDTEFPKFCLKMTLIVMGMGFTENILYDVYSVQEEGSSLEGNRLIEKLYKTGTREFAKFVPHYSPFTSALFIYATKFGTYSWNFGDIFLITLCRALCHKFKQINEEIHSNLCEFLEMDHLKLEKKQNKILPAPATATLSGEHQPFQIYFLEPAIGEGCQRKQAFWNCIREKILALCDLAEEVTNFVGPLVLACYGYNIFFIILNSLSFLYISKYDTSAYVYVSTVQFAMRVVLVTYHASQVYHSTEEIFKSMERYPDSFFPPTAYRLERMLARHPVGVTIFGAVPITRKFFISILSFLFTTEIVLLQAMSAAKVRKEKEAEITVNATTAGSY